jgi:hypothetical protein
MQREDALLYLCCTQDMSAQRLELLVALLRGQGPDRESHSSNGTAALNWDMIFTLAHEHGVAPLVYQNLLVASANGAPVPSSIQERFRLATYQNVLVKQKQAGRLSKILAYLQAREIDAMILKGAALDLMVYNQPWYTVAHDVDLVLRPRCRCSLATYQAELKARFQGTGIEYEFDTHHDMTLNGALAIDFERIWRDARVADFDGYPVYLMSPEDTLLAVCINSCRKRYFRLRSLCDIAETIKRYPDLDWDLFTRKALDARANSIVYTALTVAQSTVGCCVPPAAMDRLAVRLLKRKTTKTLIRHLVHHRSLERLSYYVGPKFVARTVGWSLLLPYITYSWRQMYSKIQEALAIYLSPRA